MTNAGTGQFAYVKEPFGGLQKHNMSQNRRRLAANSYKPEMDCILGYLAQKRITRAPTPQANPTELDAQTPVPGRAMTC